MDLFQKRSSLRYIFISLAVIAAGFLSALWVYSGT